MAISAAIAVCGAERRRKNGAACRSWKVMIKVTYLGNVYAFKDNGESSYTFDRPDYKAVEAFIKKHKGQNQYFIIMAIDSAVIYLKS